MDPEDVIEPDEYQDLLTTHRLEIILKVGYLQRSIDNMEPILNSRVAQEYVAVLIAVGRQSLPVGHLQYIQQEESSKQPYP